MNPPEDIRNIVVEGTLPHSPAKVWRALTESGLISEWLMPNDFAPVVGHKFNFRTHPIGDWDGVVNCEVTRVVPERELAYTWKGGTKNDPRFGSPLDTTVTWTLTPVEGGTHLRFVHAGFRSPGNDFAYNAMSPGWSRVVQGIGRVAARL
jgi:uncharacterized protein YndB with AHSA1/START domain